MTLHTLSQKAGRVRERSTLDMRVDIYTTYSWTCPRCGKKSPWAFRLKNIRTNIQNHQQFVHSIYDTDDSGIDKDVIIIKQYSTV